MDSGVCLCEKSDLRPVYLKMDPRQKPQRFKGSGALNCHCTRSGHGKNRSDNGSIGTPHAPVTGKSCRKSAPFLGCPPSSLPAWLASDEGGFATHQTAGRAPEVHRPATGGACRLRIPPRCRSAGGKDRTVINEDVCRSSNGYCTARGYACPVPVRAALALMGLANMGRARHRQANPVDSANSFDTSSLMTRAVAYRPDCPGCGY